MPNHGTFCLEWSVIDAASLASQPRWPPQHVGIFDAPDARFHHVDLLGPLFPITRAPFPPYLCGSVHSMVWSHPFDQLLHRHCHPRLPAKLDCSIWRIKVSHNRPRPQFESTPFVKHCEFMGCERIRTTAYHPPPTDMVERLHWQLKATLMSNAARKHWVDHLPIVLLAIRPAFKLDVNACAAELVYGSTRRLPRGFLEQATPPVPGDVNDLRPRLRLFFCNQQLPCVSNASFFPDARLKTCSHVIFPCGRGPYAVRINLLMMVRVKCFHKVLSKSSPWTRAMF